MNNEKIKAGDFSIGFNDVKTFTKSWIYENKQFKIVISSRGFNYQIELIPLIKTHYKEKLEAKGFDQAMKKANIVYNNYYTYEKNVSNRKRETENKVTK